MAFDAPKELKWGETFYEYACALLASGERGEPAAPYALAISRAFEVDGTSKANAILDPLSTPELFVKLGDGKPGARKLRAFEYQLPLGLAADEASRPVLGPRPRLIAIAGLETSNVLAAVNKRLSKPFHPHLVSIRGDRPISFLGRFDAEATDKSSWSALLEIKPGEEHGGLCALVPTKVDDTTSFLDASLESADDPKRPALNVHFERVLTHDGTALTRELTFSPRERLLNARKLGVRLGVRAPDSKSRYITDRVLPALDVTILDAGTDDTKGEASTVRVGGYDLTIPAEFEGRARKPVCMAALSRGTTPKRRVRARLTA